MLEAELCIPGAEGSAFNDTVHEYSDDDYLSDGSTESMYSVIGSDQAVEEGCTTDIITCPAPADQREIGVNSQNDGLRFLCSFYVHTALFSPSLFLLATLKGAFSILK